MDQNTSDVNSSHYRNQDASGVNALSNHPIQESILASPNCTCTMVASTNLALISMGILV
jgi:hypothetical protein